MPDLQKYPARRCLTAAGVLIHNNKVLLIKHKLAGFWLPPGGHVDVNELPHVAAEREFWEESNIRVKAVSAYPLIEESESEYLPMPFAFNLHWIKKDRYESRIASAKPELMMGDVHSHIDENGNRLCEQHYTIIYLVKPVDENAVEAKQNVEETDGISWFGLDEVANLETMGDVKAELKKAFELSP